ncbi:MAG: hypothetical protein WDA07_06400 [Leucobacter sp.]
MRVPLTNYVIHDPDGSIVRAGMCEPEQVATQPLVDGEQILIGEGRPGTHYVKDGEILAYTPEQREARSTFPPYLARWDNTLMRWVDLRDLETIRIAAWEAIKRRREQAFAARAVSSAGIAYAITKDKGNLADRRASLEDSIIVGAATEATKIEWRDFDDESHLLNLFELRLLAAEMGARGQAIFVRSWVLDSAVRAANSNGEVEAILMNQLEVGWPA